MNAARSPKDTARRDAVRRDTARRDAALRVTELIADRLADPARVRALTIDATSDDGVPEHSVWRDLTLSAGYPAVAVLYAELSAYDPERWRAPLHAYLTAAVAAARGTDSHGLHGGRGSLAVALRAAHRATGGYAGALSTVDDAVAGRLRARLTGFPPGPVGFGDYDVIAGLAGLLRYLLGDLGRHRGLAADTAAALAALCLRDGERPGWWASHGPDLLSPWPPTGHGNLGLAHGAAGILAALASAGLSGVDAPGRDGAVDALAGWLLANGGEDAHGPYWPPYVPFGGAAPGKGRSSWCYGTPGIALALDLGARLRGRPDWRAHADRALDAALAAPDGLPDAGLCHGSAGLAHLLWRLDAVAHREAIGETVDAVLDAYDPGSAFGYRCVGDQGPLDHPGLLEGAAGTALALHRYARGEDPRTGWDAVMMI